MRDSVHSGNGNAEDGPDKLGYDDDDQQLGATGAAMADPQSYDDDFEDDARPANRTTAGGAEERKDYDPFEPLNNPE